MLRNKGHRTDRERHRTSRLRRVPSFLPRITGKRHLLGARRRERIGKCCMTHRRVGAAKSAVYFPTLLLLLLLLALLSTTELLLRNLHRASIHLGFTRSEKERMQSILKSSARRVLPNLVESCRSLNTDVRIGSSSSSSLEFPRAPFLGENTLANSVRRKIHSDVDPWRRCGSRTDGTCQSCYSVRSSLLSSEGHDEHLCECLDAFEHPLISKISPCQVMWPVMRCSNERSWQ